jgi:hypothetical protein
MLFSLNHNKRFLNFFISNKALININQNNTSTSKSLMKLIKYNLFTKPNSDMRDENPNGLTLNNIYSFEAQRMKINKNKIILGQSHLGLKTSRNETFLIYQTEETNTFLIGRKFIYIALLILLIYLVNKYKSEGFSKFAIYSIFGCLLIYAVIQPATNMSRNIRKIELHKNLDFIYVTLYNNKVLKVANNQIYFNSNFRNISSSNNNKITIGIKGKNYFTSLRLTYIPNFDLFNCVIRGFNLGYDTQYKNLV